MTSERYLVGEAVGASMAPALRAGDLLVVDQRARRVGPGDVVLFGDVAHRLVWIDPWGALWETGDAPTVRLRRRTIGEVRGRIAMIVRDGAFVDVPRAPRLQLRKVARALLARLSP